MNDDINEKRKEKVESFKLHIEGIEIADIKDHEEYAEASRNSGNISSNPDEPLNIESQARRDKIENFKLHIEDFHIEIPDENTDIASAEKMASEKTADSENNVLFSTNELSSQNDVQNIIVDEALVTPDGIDAAESIQSYSSAPTEEKYSLVDRKEIHKAKKADKHRLKMKSKKNRMLFRIVWVVMAVMIAVVIGEYFSVGISDMLAVNRKESTVVIDIPQNASFDDIVDILVKNDVIENPGFFKLYAGLTNGTDNFTNGSFEIDTNLDYLEIISYLQSNTNRTDTVTIQFIEGNNVREYAEQLKAEGVCDDAAFLEMCNSDIFDEDYPFLAEIKNKSQRYYKLEGYLFPDTYIFYKNEDPETVIRKMLNNYNSKIYHTKKRTDGFEKRVTIEERAKEANMTVDQVITLASIIQAEAADVDDMYYVSSVLHNRLNTASNDGVSPYGDGGLVRLQTDSTMYYPYKSKTQVPIGERATFKSRYNTYELEGLPPGSICNPSWDAIDAALSPEETDYYFFCHRTATSEYGAKSYYATTNEEHEANLVEAGLKNNEE